MTKLRLLALPALICCAVMLLPSAAGAITVSQRLAALESRVTKLEKTVASQKTEIARLKKSKVMKLEPYVNVYTTTASGLKGPRITFSGANVLIRNGLGSTPTKNGLGNLVVGYNETSNPLNPQRTGSHNLVVGSKHHYTSWGGLVAGYANAVSGPYGSVAGGQLNTASGNYSVVSGGDYNAALGLSSAVSGGSRQKATGAGSSVSGGYKNTASGWHTSVSGGDTNEASGGRGSVSGGAGNEAIGEASWVGAGQYNNATGAKSSVSGGSGGQATALMASVSGGISNQAFGQYATVNGGKHNEASGDYSVISGGLNNKVTGGYSWLGGAFGCTNGAPQSSQFGGQGGNLEPGLLAGGSYLGCDTHSLNSHAVYEVWYDWYY